MCGLTGFLGGFTAQTAAAAGATLRSMTDAIAHRGPDSDGHWLDASCAIAIGHRRLAIVDLSSAGNQPMHSGAGRYVIAFNGEIYNHLDLRAELDASQPIRWRGHSDTETLLAGFDVLGIERTIGKCIGMFAFAVWDRRERILTLGRDRLGEKPLYYGWQGHGNARTFLFGSELSALRRHTSFDATVDRGALTLLMRHTYIPAPYSIFSGISKLQPGCLLAVSLAQQTSHCLTYWDAKEAVETGAAHSFDGTREQAVDTLERLLKDAIRKQMVSDVPLGAFLSGGVDSSTVVALMQTLMREQGGSAVKTFTIGFTEPGYDEAEHAKRVARHLGTAHTEVYVSPQDALDVIPKLPTLYAEPFADSSQIPTYLVSQMAREHVTVSLSGDGGDELFGGYGRYAFANSLWAKVAPWPMGVRRFAAGTLTGISPAGWNRLLGPGERLFRNRGAPLNLGDKLHKGAALLAAETEVDFYRLIVSAWADPATIVINAAEPTTALTNVARLPAPNTFIERMMALDMLSYLPDDILCKVDRAAMGVSLETRVPMLDHRLVEFASTLPLAYKIHEGSGKWPLKQVLYRHVPRSLIERPKMGFGIPLHAWLRGPLRTWAEELLDESQLRREGYFHAAPIRQKWQQHSTGARNWAHVLWPVLMFQAWMLKDRSNGLNATFRESERPAVPAC